MAMQYIILLRTARQTLLVTTSVLQHTPYSRYHFNLFGLNCKALLRLHFCLTLLEMTQYDGCTSPKRAKMPFGAELDSMENRSSR